MAFEHYGIDPDMVTLGKAIANGLPLSAVIGRKSIMGSVEPGSIGGTYGGNPVATAVAIKVPDIIWRDNLCKRAENLGKIIAEHLEELYNAFDIIGEHRGLGVMRAIELVKNRKTKEPAKKITKRVHLSYAIVHPQLHEDILHFDQMQSLQTLEYQKVRNLLHHFLVYLEQRLLFALCTQLFLVLL